MRRNRRILLFCLLLLVIAMILLWWAKPENVDMAGYAPADALLYVESNQPLKVVEAIAGTDGWQAFERLTGSPSTAPRSHVLQSFIRWTGIGPVQSVILARAQVAAVVTDLGAVEEGEALRIKQEEAILIETHTSVVRIKAPFEQALKTLAEKFYGRPTVKRITLEGVEFVEWNAPDSTRQIVGVMLGSLVIIGNTEHVVKTCLAVAQGKSQSLQGDPELKRMRLKLGGAEALTFGYVPAKNSARLLAIGLPMLLDHAPGDSEFQRMITSGASKVFGSLAWTSRPYRAGIEDQYLISLAPTVVSRLEPAFSSGDLNSRLQSVVPAEAYSVSSYRFANPAAAWQSLRGAVSSQVDTLSSIVFSTLLKSALLSYGVEDPDAFLGAVAGELFTIRLDENAEHSLLIAGVRDRALLRELIIKRIGAHLKTNRIGHAEVFEDAQSEFGAALSDELIVMGDSATVSRYLAEKQRSSQLSPARLRQMAFFTTGDNSANIVTYTNDADRVRNFLLAAGALRGAPIAPEATNEAVLASLPFAVTETILGEHGIERTTRSPLGQFSTLLPLLVPPPPTQRINQPPSQ
jgi:hypothetical protein